MEGYTEVFAWGGDHFGQLGLGTKHAGKTYPSPRFCSFNVLIRSLSCGEEHSAFISSSGHVYSMGSNSEGRLGLGDKSMRSSSSPCLVEAIVNHRSLKVSCGWGHTGIITEDGQVFAWGVGEFGALGSGNSENQWTPLRAQLPRGVRALDVSCGSRHTGIVVDEGRNTGIMMTGSGEAGQLGTGKREKEFRFVGVSIGEEATSVACGVFHSLVLSNTGKIYAMGGNSFGQLGLGTKKSCSRPEKLNFEGFAAKIACGSHSAAITDKGVLFVWGTGVFGEYLVPTRLSVTACKEVSIGGNFGMALDVNGELYSWGANSNGELGLGDFEPKIAPTLVTNLRGKAVKKLSCGGNYVIALGSDFGDNRQGSQLLIENETGRIQKRDESVKKSESFKRPSIEAERLRPESENRVRDRLKDSNGFRNREADRSTPVKLNKSRVEETKVVERNSQFRLENRNNEDLHRNEGIRDLQGSIHIRNALDDSQKQNFILSQELKNYKDEVVKLRRTIEDLKVSQTIATSQKIEDLNQSLQHKHLYEIQDLRLLQEQELIKRKQLEKNLEVSSKHIANLEEALQKSNLENSELRRQALENTRASGELKLTAQQELDKVHRENSELRRKIDLILQEKDRNEASMNKENFELKRRVENILVEKERNEANLKSDLDLLNNRCSEFQQLINNLTAENQHVNIIFSKEVNKSQQEISEYRHKQEQLIHEKEHSIKSLQTEIFALSSDLQSTKSSLEAQIAQNHDLSMQLSEKDFQLSHTNNEASQCQSENDYQKKLLEDLKFQNSRYNQENSELNNRMEKMQIELHGWETDYRNLLNDNKLLKESVAELEFKNRELFENLEKELAQRAKEYKERTISMLNTPGRSVSPYLRSHHQRERSEEFVYSTNKVETEENPGFVQNSKYLTIAQAYKGSGTPTKDDVRNRIASLMRNRSRIEEQIHTIENE